MSSEPATFDAPSVHPSPHIPSTFTDNLPLPRLFVFDLDYTLWPFWVDTHVTPPLKPATSRDSSKPQKSTWRGFLHAQLSNDGDSKTESKEKDKDNNEATTSMVDRYGEHFSFYPGVPAVLHAARQKGIKMSVASRTHAPAMAKEMLRGLYVMPPPVSHGTATDEQDQGRPNTTSNKKDTPFSLSRSRSKDKDKDKDKSQQDTTPRRAFDYFIHPQMYPGSKTAHFRKIQSATGSDRANFPGGKVAFEDMLFFDDEARNRNVESELNATFVLVRDGVGAKLVDEGVWAWRRRRGFGRGRGKEQEQEQEQEQEWGEDSYG